METIFKNGNILTMEETTSRAEALAVQFGRIYRVGKTAEVEELARPTTKIIDLKGQTLLPGFIDTHNHFCLYALLTDQADCRPAAGCVRGEDVVEALRAKAANTPPGDGHFCSFNFRHLISSKQYAIITLGTLNFRHLI